MGNLISNLFLLLYKIWLYKTAKKTSWACPVECHWNNPLEIEAREAENK